MGRPGYIKLHRSIEDWKYWHEPNALAIWIHILDAVNYDKSTFFGVEVPEGSAAISISRLASNLNLSRTTVTKWINAFRDDGQIKTKRYGRFILVEVSNWKKYQNERGGVQVTEQLTEHQGEQLTEHQGEHQGEHIKRNKEVKKLRNKEILSPKPPYEGGNNKIDVVDDDEERQRLLAQLKGE